MLLTVGSQGDVQPFVALAVRLRAGGHQAVLAAPAAFSGLASAYDVPFVPLELDVGQVGEAVAGRYGLRHLLRFCRAAGRRTAAMLPALETAAEGGADLVVHHPVLPLGQHMAELLGVPAVVGLPLPALMPTREFPSAVWPCRVPRMLNRPSYLAAGRLSGAWCRKDVDRWRRDALDLPPRRGRHDSLVSGDGAPVTVLHAFSEHILPRPADWPATAHVTGYWLLPAPEGWSPPRRLAAFLEDGGPVAYVGFGSMPNLDSARLAASIMTAAEDNDVRVVVASLDPALRRLLPSGRFLVIRSAPHDWLFPRMDAIVHHGGAGTTAAALHAGKPQAYDYSGQLELATAGEVGYSITDMAGDLTELIRAVTTGPAHLIGHCLGGFVARSAAVSEPDLVRSLTLVACGPDMRDEKHQSMLEGLARLHANGGTIALWPLVKALIAKDDTVMREFWHAKLSEMNPYWVTGTAESMADEPDRSGELVAAGIPSLVVFGKRDRRVWSHDTYAGMASRLRADHVIIPKASHSPNMEQPAILAEALLEFFAAEAALEDTPATVAG